VADGPAARRGNPERGRRPRVARESGRFEECLLLQTAIVRRMVDALPLRIFLASPGDLEGERAAVRACVEEHRARRDGARSVGQ